MTDKQKIKKIVEWMKLQLQETNMAGFVFGLSGGIDSALIAAIVAKYFPKNYLALRMNINNQQEDILDQKLLVNNFSLNCQDVNLTDSFKSIVKDLKLEKAQEGNLGARMRMVALYSMAQKLNYLVLGTSNFNEIYLGYFTKYGDGGCDIMPLANLTKMEVWQLSKVLDVPQKIINKKPSAGFYYNQTDEADLGFSYQAMEDFFQKRKVDQSTKNKIKKFHTMTSHKRKFPKTILPINKLMTKENRHE